MTENTYIIEPFAPQASIGIVRDYNGFKLPTTGDGYFAGSFPDGITTIAGKPVSALVRVLLRSTINGYGDGSVVAETTSAQDGTWRIDGIPMGFKYDITARYQGENDVIVSNVSPVLM